MGQARLGVARCEGSWSPTPHDHEPELHEQLTLIGVDQLPFAVGEEVANLEAAAADRPQRDPGGKSCDALAGGARESESVGRVGDLLGVLAVDDGR